MHFRKELGKAARDYRYLLDKAYPTKATIKLVGDRYRLDKKERIILFRGILDTATSQAISRRILTTLPEDAHLGLDGYNILFTLVNYWRGHPLFIGTDGLLRDAGGAHGRIGREEDFSQALDLLVDQLQSLKIVKVDIFLDSPISKSGIHTSMLRTSLDTRNISGNVILCTSADPRVRAYIGEAVATSDSAIALSSQAPIFDLARIILETRYGCIFPQLSGYLNPLDATIPTSF